MKITQDSNEVKQPIDIAHPNGIFRICVSALVVRNAGYVFKENDREMRLIGGILLHNESPLEAILRILRGVGISPSPSNIEFYTMLEHFHEEKNLKVHELNFIYKAVYRSEIKKDNKHNLVCIQRKEFETCQISPVVHNDIIHKTDAMKVTRYQDLKQEGGHELSFENPSFSIVKKTFERQNTLKFNAATDFENVSHKDYFNAQWIKQGEVFLISNCHKRELGVRIGSLMMTIGIIIATVVLLVACVSMIANRGGMYNGIQIILAFYIILIACLPLFIIGSIIRALSKDKNTLDFK